MKIVEAFSKFAYEYNKYNIIQKEVAKKLTSFLKKDNYEKILDLGSGDGEIYKHLQNKNIKIKEFLAFDFSEEMLSLHPTNSCIKKVCLDFNEKTCFSNFSEKEFDVVISSSALQWSEDLKSIFMKISKLSSEYYFSFFTSNTFKTLHETANITSPIYSKEKIIDALDKTFIYESEIIQYRLEFDSVHDMLRYIKKSGVSGGVEQLSYSQMKALMVNYPLDYLEFEVLFVKVIRCLDN